MSRNIFERQKVKSITVELTINDIAGGGFTAKLPQGAWITNVIGQVDVAFNTAGATPTCKLSLGDASSATLFVNAQSVAATGAITVATTKKFYPTGGLLTGTLTEGVASGDITTATVGHATLHIEYVELGEGGVIEG